MADTSSSTKNTDSSATGAAKINNVNMFSGVYADRGPRPERPAEEREVRTGATKPVFKGKGKFKTGGPATEETANPTISYDFSKMRMSAAKSGAPNPNREDEGEGGRRGGPRQGMQASGSRTFGEDDDFEVVTDKKKGAAAGGFRRANF